jgi:O-antigen/teichoic acid export membrane protein
MSTEARRGAVRILSNYSRLLITLGLGILVVPLTLRWLGDDAFGIISLLGANIGLAGIFRQIIQMSLVRELGQAHHADDDTFKRSYATICTIALVCAILSILSFSIVFALLPVFQISPEFMGPARWFIFGQGVYTASIVLLSPILNMYLVKERFIGYNIWYIGVRAGNILSVIILGYVFVIDNPALGLKLHGMLWAFLSIAAMLIAAWVMVRTDRRLVFRVQGSDKDARSQVLSTFSWNTGVQIAMNLHEQIPPLLLNLFFGTLANAAWGIGFRFVAYIRMCTTGVQFGSDAVSARLASGNDSDESRRKLQQLIAIQTKLTSMIALPAGVFVFVYSWPVFHVWVGQSIDDYDAIMPVAVYMTRILSVALCARAISETWIIILYGSGYIKAYAPWIFAGGIFAPLASVALMLTLPEKYIIYAPPSMFAIVFVVVHLFGLPIIAGKCLHIHASSLLLSLIKPLVATMCAVACGIALLSFGGQYHDLGINGVLDMQRGDSINWYWMLGSMGVFGFVYAVGCVVWILDGSERARVMNGINQLRSKIQR